MRSWIFVNLFMAFAVLSLSAEAEAKLEKTLFVGDSHSYGKFGEKVDEYLRTMSNQVTTVASCGSSPSTWVTKGSNYKSTNCGYWSKDSHGRETRVKSHDIKSFSGEISKINPDLTVIALGTNILASPANIKKEKESIQQILNEINVTGSRCVWVGPPDVRKQPFQANLAEGVREIRALVEKYGCQYIDSTKLTKYPSGGDGIHYGPSQAAEWGTATAKEIDKNLKALPRVLLEAAKSAPQTAPAETTGAAK